MAGNMWAERPNYAIAITALYKYEYFAVRVVDDLITPRKVISRRGNICVCVCRKTGHGRFDYYHRLGGQIQCTTLRPNKCYINSDTRHYAVRAIRYLILRSLVNSYNAVVRRRFSNADILANNANNVKRAKW